MQDHAFKVNMLDLKMRDIRSVGLTRGCECYVCDYLMPAVSLFDRLQSCFLTTTQTGKPNWEKYKHNPLEEAVLRRPSVVSAISNLV